MSTAVILTEENLTITPEEAREWIGRGTSFIREALVNGVDWGTAVQMPSGQWNFIIYTAKLLDTLGIPYIVVLKKVSEKFPLQQTPTTNN